ncbi:MAG TPA: winged helix-turn-helix domain-containing protein [Vicinamibacterales bacterium]|nr:winged helix-turn-helix domain-containing protein [Vicinamibacterales bacterium]
MGNYCFGDFRIDTRLRRLYRRNDLLPLTPKAFDTLLALVERAGRVVEKDELLRAVWGDTVVGDETLAQNVSTLRRVLGDQAERPEFIATVPRCGYRFIAATTNEAVGAAADAPVGSTSIRKRTLFHRSAAVALFAGVSIFGGWLADGRWRLEPPRAAVEFTVSEPDHWVFSTSGNMLALSPNGKQLAFIASDANGSPWLWLRPLDSAVPRLLAGTNGASQPFWSPDNNMLAFFADRRLKTIDVVTGAVRVVAMLPISARVVGGTWNREGDILFAVPDDGLYLVPSAGATPRRINLKGAGCEGCVAWPGFLPDGRHFLFTVVSADSDTTGVYVGELGTTKGQRLIDVMSSCIYAAPGFLLYARSSTLYAQPFDAVRLRLVGVPVPVADAVAYNAITGRVLVAAADSGVIAYRGPPITELVWMNRFGTRQRVAAPAGTYFGFSIAPDGRRIAAARLDPRIGTTDIWMFGPDEREVRVTDNPAWDTSPVWSTDGKYIVYASRRQNRSRLYRRNPTAIAPEELLLESDTPIMPLQTVSANDVVYAAQRARLPFDLWQLADGRRATPLLRIGGMYPADARLSLDGHWLSYAVPERTEMPSAQTVYVSRRPFLETRRAIAHAASAPRWRSDGRELFYVSQDSSLIAVSIDDQATPTASPGRVLFRSATLGLSGIVGQAYDVAPDGDRFLLKLQAGSSPIHAVVNWSARLSK